VQPFVILNFASILPDDWIIQIFHSDLNGDYILSFPVLRRLHTNGRLVLTFLPEARNLTMTLDPKRMLNRLLATTTTFWDRCVAEKLLFFQLDSVLCSRSMYTADDFLHFDWIGAPWAHLKTVGGNGIASLYSVFPFLLLVTMVREARVAQAGCLYDRGQRWSNASKRCPTTTPST
jgi:hypothetical protein